MYNTPMFNPVPMRRPMPMTRRYYPTPMMHEVPQMYPDYGMMEMQPTPDLPCYHDDWAYIQRKRDGMNVLRCRACQTWFECSAEELCSTPGCSLALGCGKVHCSYDGDRRPSQRVEAPKPAVSRVPQPSKPQPPPIDPTPSETAKTKTNVQGGGSDASSVSSNWTPLESSLPSSPTASLNSRPSHADLGSLIRHKIHRTAKSASHRSRSLSPHTAKRSSSRRSFSQGSSRGSASESVCLPEHFELHQAEYGNEGVVALTEDILDALLAAVDEMGVPGLVEHFSHCPPLSQQSLDAPETPSKHSEGSEKDDKKSGLNPNAASFDPTRKTRTAVPPSPSNTSSHCEGAGPSIPSTPVDESFGRSMSTRSLSFSSSEQTGFPIPARGYGVMNQQGMEDEAWGGMMWSREDAAWRAPSNGNPAPWR